MLLDNKIWIAQGEENVYLLPKMANRHGLIAGATGTGKTITLKVLAESFSDLGVPTFLADVKGDLSGMIEPGDNTEDMQKRLARFGIENFTYKKYPTHFWDLFGEKGHPVRVTVSDMGPVLLSRLLGLTEVQAGVLNIVFKVADDEGLLLLDFKDLRLMLQYVADHKAEYTVTYGNVSTQSVGAIQRALLAYEDEGAELFFGEPNLDINDWLRCDSDGRGYINILSSETLIHKPKTYSMFLLWMLSDLYEKLPEVGDLDKPRMVFFFDEAHLLFTDAPKALVEKIELIVKLIRSKGVGVYFITQNPSDIPDSVLAQCSNRIQHALRAYTPAETKAVKTAAKSFRVNPNFKTEDAIMELAVGEALISCLDEKGIPAIVQRARVLPPMSRMGAASTSSIEKAIKTSEFENKYREPIDRRSAYEIIEEANAEAEAARLEEEAAAAEKERKKANANKNKVAEKAVNSVTSTVARSVGSNLVKTVTGGKKQSAGKIAERAATNVMSTLLREGTKSITRGLFGNKK